MRPRAIVAVLATLAVGGSAAFYALTIPRLAVNEDLPPRQADLANGETMFNIGGCASCHATPSQEDTRRLGGGLALKTPFGTFRVPNISSDPKNGIGAWPERSFRQCHAARRRAQRRASLSGLPLHVLPAHDARSTCATSSPFSSRCRPTLTPSMPHDLGFPFNVRRGLGLWKLLYLDGKTFAPDASRERDAQPGCLSRRGARPLRGMPQLSQPIGWAHQRAAIRGRRRMRKARAGCQTSRHMPMGSPPGRRRT